MLQFKKVAYHTLGCKLNFSETSTIARQLKEAGYARVSWDDNPDVFIINTCSVTEHADKKCRNAVRKALKVNPEGVVIVIGCYAQLKPAEIASIPGVNLVLGAEEKFNVVAYLERENIVEKQRYSAGEIKNTRQFIPGYSSGDRTRTFLKVQDGCNYFCSFCTIPLARGRSRSATVAETVDVAHKAAAEGAKEIVLTGVNIGDFGHGSSEKLIDLLRRLDQLKGVERFRISSIEPNLLTDEIIGFVSESRLFVPHFHIPLQSGSDAVLAAMRRRYRTALYRERIESIKRLMPRAGIGVDVITGFPGEGETEFAETLHFLKDLPVSYLHVFTYSERPNTTALRIQDVVPLEVRQERNKQLRMLSHKLQRAFYTAQAGTVRPVLFEAEEQNGQMFGFTDNYIKVKIPFEASLVNAVVPVEIGHTDRDGVAFAKTVTNAYV